MIQRRGFLTGIGALLFAPAIIRTHGLLMPVKAPLIVGQPVLTVGAITEEELKILHNRLYFGTPLMEVLDKMAFGIGVSPLRIRLPLDYAVNQNPVDTGGS